MSAPHVHYTPLRSLQRYPSSGWKGDKQPPHVLAWIPGRWQGTRGFCALKDFSMVILQSSSHFFVTTGVNKSTARKPSANQLSSMSFVWSGHGHCFVCHCLHFFPATWAGRCSNGKYHVNPYPSWFSLAGEKEEGYFVTCRAPTHPLSTTHTSWGFSPAVAPNQ